MTIRYYKSYNGIVGSQIMCVEAVEAAKKKAGGKLTKEQESKIFNDCFSKAEAKRFGRDSPAPEPVKGVLETLGQASSLFDHPYFLPVAVGLVAIIAFLVGRGMR